MAQRNWRYLLFLLTAHHPKHKLDHTLHLAGNVYVCSRCTGVAFGIAAVLASAFIGFGVAAPYVFVLIGVLPVFAAVDWFTQSARKRQSSTPLRLGTGFLLGISEGLVVLFVVRLDWVGLLASAALAGVYAASIYLVASKTGCLHSYLAELNGYPLEQQALKA